MSDAESEEVRGELRSAAGKTLARLARAIAVVVGLGGLAATIYDPRSQALVVTFFAFIAYLVSDFLLRARR